MWLQSGSMDRRPREIAQDVMDDEAQYPLTRQQTDVDYPYFKQVLALYWIERNTEMP